MNVGSKIAPIAFLFTLLLSYSSLSISKYQSLIVNSHIQTLPTSKLERLPCYLNSTKSADCKLIYRISIPSTPNSSWLGTGAIIPSSRYKCSDGSIIKEYDNPENPGKDFGLFSTYQYVEIPKKCTGFIDIEVWANKNNLRSGHIDGEIIFGDFKSITTHAKIFEFLSTGLMKIILALFFLGALIHYIYRKFLGIREPFSKTIQYWPVWVVCTAITSHLAQDIVPLEIPPLFFNRVSGWLSLTAHFLILYAPELPQL